MKIGKIKHDKYLSISYCASSLIFIITIVYMIKSLVSKWDSIFLSIQTIIDINDSQTKMALLFFIVLMFVPSFIYLIKLNFSLIAFESSKDSHEKYLKKMGRFSLMVENLLRFMVFGILLLYLSNMYDNLIQISETMFPFPIEDYGHFEDSSNYFPIYKGFPYLKDIILFNYLFFILLLFWDISVYIGNRLNNNKLNRFDFFFKFIMQHLIGFIIWFIFTFLLLTQNGHLLIHKGYIWVIISLAFLSIFYLVVVIKSLKSLIIDFKNSLYLVHG